MASPIARFHEITVVFSTRSHRIEMGYLNESYRGSGESELIRVELLTEYYRGFHFISLFFERMRLYCPMDHTPDS